MRGFSPRYTMYPHTLPSPMLPVTTQSTLFLSNCQSPHILLPIAILPHLSSTSITERYSVQLLAITIIHPTRTTPLQDTNFHIAPPSYITLTRNLTHDPSHSHTPLLLLLPHLQSQWSVPVSPRPSPCPSL
jgi:hypothetical protein